MARAEIRDIEAGRAVCPSFGRCGGCTYLGLSEEECLGIKEAQVLKCLEDEGVDTSVFTGITAAPLTYRYRNKMEYTFGNEVKDGPTILGLHAVGSFISITPCGSCVLVPEDFNRLLTATQGFVSGKGYSHYHKKLHRGLMRSLIIRRGVRTGELLVNIVTSSDGEFDEDGYKRHIMSISFDDNIVGILHTINDSRSDALVAEEVRILYGRDWYSEEILGLKFRVGAFSFFQTNVEAAERLYLDAVSLIDSFEDKTVFDLYCGTGTITQFMARKAKKAVGVEIVEGAVRTASDAAKINGLDNCEFIAGDVGEVLSALETLPDVIVVDPPRAGIMPKALARILSYGVENIVYISCNPKTLASNLRAAALAGYDPARIRAYDNFSFTKHTECIALLERI